MAMVRWLLAAMVFVNSALLAFACGSTAVPGGATAEAGLPDASLGEGAWGSTTCAACTFAACRQERVDCRAEPGCARNLDCVEACPGNGDGDPEPACVARCPIASSTAAETPRLALERCRRSGRATSCPTCAGAGRRRYTNPLLTSTCENATYDAGPDATPVQEGCSRCISKRCCDARDACNAGLGCVPLKDCWAGCPDRACEVACYAQHDGSVGRLFGFLGCVEVRCGPECGYVKKPCAACIDDQCGDERVDCNADHDCFLLGECVAQCSLGFSCVQACKAKYPGAVSLLERLTLCGQARCPPCR